MLHKTTFSNGFHPAKIKRIRSHTGNILNLFLFLLFLTVEKLLNSTCRPRSQEVEEGGNYDSTEETDKQEFNYNMDTATSLGPLE